jgi:hypothetical protein
MLLEKVEKIVSRNLNIIRREIEKEFIAEYDYTANIGQITINDVDGYLYLATSTLTYLQLGDDDVPYTTFEYQNLYNGKKSIPIRNKAIRLNNIIIGYENNLNYLHLPDFLTTQLLNKGVGVKAITKNVIINFEDGNAKVYKHHGDVFTPYYVFNESFEYNYETADSLAQLIGIFDAYKRGLLFTSEDDELTKMNKESRALFYLFFPYVSLIVYRDLGTTLFPHHTFELVSKVSRLLRSEGKGIINNYKENTLDKLESLTESLSGKSILN